MDRCGVEHKADVLAVDFYNGYPMCRRHLLRRIHQDLRGWVKRENVGCPEHHGRELYISRLQQSETIGGQIFLYCPAPVEERNGDDGYNVGQSCCEFWIGMPECILDSIGRNGDG